MLERMLQPGIMNPADSRDQAGSTNHTETTKQRSALFGMDLAALRHFLGIPEKQSEREPGVSVEIFYSKHASMGDALRLKRSLKNAQVFVPEMLGRPEWYQDDLQRISDGADKPLMDIDPLTMSESAFFEYELKKALHKSGVKIECVDIPPDSSRPDTLYRRYIIMEGKTRRLSEELRVGIFSQPLNTLLTHIRNVEMERATVQKERERYMAEQLKALVVRIRKEQPNEHVRILIQLGSNHTGLYYLLKESNILTSRTMADAVDGTTTFPLLLAPQRKAKFFDTLSIKDCAPYLFFLVIARLYNAECGHLLSRGGSQDDIASLITHILARFSFNELSAFYETILSFSQNNAQREQRARYLFDDLLEQRGVTFPTTVRALREHVRGRGIKKRLNTKK